MCLMLEMLHIYNIFESKERVLTMCMITTELLKFNLISFQRPTYQLKSYREIGADFLWNVPNVQPTEDYSADAVATDNSTAAQQISKMTVEYLSAEPLPNITQFDNQRLKFLSGLCVSVAQGSTQLTVDFCSPKEKQPFRLTEQGQLVHQGTGQCVSVSSKDTVALFLGGCYNAPVFSLQPAQDGYLLSHTMRRNKRCISQLGGRGDSVGLGSCTTPLKHYPSLTLIPEASFVIDRRLLLLPRLPEDPDCDFPACGINARPPPVRPLLDPTQPCVNLTVSHDSGKDS